VRWMPSAARYITPIAAALPPHNPRRPLQALDRSTPVVRIEQAVHLGAAGFHQRGHPPSFETPRKRAAPQDDGGGLTFRRLKNTTSKYTSIRIVTAITA
jgi:hypothetical protein